MPANKKVYSLFFGQAVSATNVYNMNKCVYQVTTYSIKRRLPCKYDYKKRQQKLP